MVPSEYLPTMPGEFWDLHCDLPLYCGWKSQRTPWDPECPCNLHQIEQGKIRHQVCALFTAPGPESREMVIRQFTRFLEAQKAARPHGVTLSWALEHAGGVFQQDWEQDWALFDHWVECAGPCSYIGPTWNGASRFGGGTGEEQGLTLAGQKLLEGMAARSIPLDFSHMSDALAADCLSWLDLHQPRHPVLASHSNVRSIQNHPRNLPLWLIDALAQREGMIGLCWYPLFVGRQPSDLLKHAELLLTRAPLAVATGADLFFPADPYPAGSSLSREPFFKELKQSADMLGWYRLCQQAFGEESAQRICGRTAARWFHQHHLVERAQV